MVRSNLSVHEACIHDLHSLLERLNFALEKILDEDFTLLLTDLHIFFPARVEQVRNHFHVDLEKREVYLPVVDDPLRLHVM